MGVEVTCTNWVVARSASKGAWVTDQFLDAGGIEADAPLSTGKHLLTGLEKQLIQAFVYRSHG
jgi:hypothetical protein